MDAKAVHVYEHEHDNDHVNGFFIIVVVSPGQ